MTTSRLSMTDWPALYRALPFHPPRGVNTIDQDIADIAVMSSRLGADQVALRALNRWRRYHTRAKIDDLVTTLKKIKRHDIAQAIHDEINPPRPETPQDDLNRLATANDALLPYIRLVERWDELRASNKIPVASQG